MENAVIILSAVALILFAVSKIVGKRNLTEMQVKFGILTGFSMNCKFDKQAFKSFSSNKASVSADIFNI